MNNLTSWYKAPAWTQKVLGTLTILALVIWTAGPLVTPQVAYAAATLSITCDNVTIDGDTWTFSGTWQAIDIAGQPATQYDAAVFSPTGVQADDSSKDSPDVFNITQSGTDFAGEENKNDAEGNWTNEVTFLTPPSEVFATLYHSQIPGAETSGDAVCEFVLPPQVATLTLEKDVVIDNGGTAVDTDWTLQATNGGDTTISGVEGAGTITDAEVPAGTYVLSESGGPSGYTNTGWSCDGGSLDGSSLTLSTGDDVICTVTNDDQPGTLIVEKILPNDDGGTATPDEFSFQVNDGDAAAFNANGQNSIEVNAGTYTVTEVDASPAYDTSYANDLNANEDCSNLAVGNGETVTCTITNDDVAPQLTVVKVVENDDATRPGTSAVGDFDLFVNFDAVISGIANFFSAGSYTVHEEGPGGYNATFSDDCAEDGSITLALGGVYTCTITNNDKAPGVLHVVKNVTNDGPEGFAGTSESGDFTISVTGGNPSPSSFAGSSLGTDVIIDAGADYSVSETDGPSGYGVSYSVGCEGTMPEGGEATCTITNNDNEPTQAYLTIVKSVINDNGGEASSSSWSLKVTDSEENETVMTNGIAALFPADTYTISESGGPSGYTQTSIACAADGGDAVEGSSLAVEAGHSYVCTIVNDDVAPSLTVQKEVTNDNGGSAEASEWTVGAVGETSISGDGSASSDGTFQAGTYTLTEEGGPSGYTAGDWSCTNEVSVNESNEITLGVGESTTCTIVNDDEPATLYVIKHVINDNGGDYEAGDFTMLVEGTNVSDSEFAGSEDGVEITLDAGEYAVTEDGPSGYGLTASEDCSGTIGVGETKTCTLTNDDGKATLTIVKETEGADGTFTFEITGEDDVNVGTSGGSGSTDVALDAGSYNVIEVVPEGWVLSGATCNLEDESEVENGISISLGVGDEVTCYFYNEAQFDLSVQKSVDDETPDIEQTIEYTVTVTNNGPKDANDIEASDVLPAGLTYVSDDGEGSYDDETGIWTVGSLASGESKSLVITVTVGSEYNAVIVNSASVTAFDEVASDYNEENNETEVSITVSGEPDYCPNLGGIQGPDVNCLDGGPTGGGGGGGGGNGSPFIGAVNGGGGAVLGASTEGQVLGESCGLYMDQYLRRGNSKNRADQVTKLQEFLNKYSYGSFTPTGFFGPLTEAAVKAFQNQYASAVLAPWGLPEPTGLAYLTTIRQLNLIECPDLVLEVPELVPWSQNPNVR